MRPAGVSIAARSLLYLLREDQRMTTQSPSPETSLCTGDPVMTETSGL